MDRQALSAQTPAQLPPLPPSRTRYTASASPPFLIPPFPTPTPCLSVPLLAAKLDSQETPPPLHYSPGPSDLVDRISPADTPISTPKGFGSSLFPRKHDRDKESFSTWDRQESPFGGSSNLYADSALLDSDFEEDSNFLLFGQSPPRQTMAHGSSPIAIGVPRNNSTSPRTSNLTYALQAKAAADLRPSPGTNFDSNPHRSSTSGRHDSISMSGLTPQYGSGAVPISVNNSGRNQPRRESLAGSMMGGMSWGGVSMNSWIRDE